jgi:hypothetical protein
MPAREFIVLRREGKIPAMAACGKCQQKFFTPDSYYGDLIGTEQYLTGKFDEHRCNKSNNESRLDAWLNRRHGK